MAKFWKQKQFWKAVSDLVVIIVLIGILMNWITEQFTPIAVFFLFVGLGATINFLWDKIQG